MYLTPCVGICKLEDDVCVGCKRTKQQITDWRVYDDDKRMEIMKSLGWGNKRKGGRKRHENNC